MSDVRLLACAAVVTVLLTTGCAGTSCQRLGALQAERDEARAQYLELVGSGTATAEQTSAADADVHNLDRRAFDLEQDCGATSAPAR